MSMLHEYCHVYVPPVSFTWFTFKRNYVLVICVTIRYDTIWSDTVRSCPSRYDTIRYNTVRCGPIRSFTVRYDKIRYETIQYDTTRHDTRHVAQNEITFKCDKGNTNVNEGAQA